MVGVTPESVQGFTAPGFNMDMFAPYMMSDALNFEGQSNHLSQRTSRSTFIKARLAPGVSVDQARAAELILAAKGAFTVRAESLTRQLKAGRIDAETVFGVSYARKAVSTM